MDFMVSVLFLTAVGSTEVHMPVEQEDPSIISICEGIIKHEKENDGYNIPNSPPDESEPGSDDIGADSIYGDYKAYKI